MSEPVIPHNEIGHRLSNTEQLKPFLMSVGSDQPDLIFGVTGRLFHYTDLRGFQGIISDHDLWLTHLRYSNDDEEMLHGQRVVSEVIAEQINAPVAPERSAFFESVKEKLTQQVDVYICCFCLEDNLLSQWRAYGANGMGVSVGIDPTEFASLTGPDSPPGGLLRVWKVFYKEDQQRKIIKTLLDCGMCQHATPEERAENTAAAIQFFVPTFKNEHFAGEQECRMIFTPEAGFKLSPKFRVGRGMLIPYFSLKDLRSLLTQPVSELPIRTVLLGPSGNKLLNKGSAEMILKAHNHEKVSVDCSLIPFRG
jgi:Protein of unknown function (DUF2971)